MKEKREMFCPYLTGVDNKCLNERCPFYMTDKVVEEFKKMILEHNGFYLIPSNCSNTITVYNLEESKEKEKS